ncbi:hypothetical protein ASD31_04525 [Rhizobium sp. Root482]|nr:hypothetical protein ASD31_04525 [Rhizobium sp. Root482]
MQITVFMVRLIALRSVSVKRSGALQHHMMKYWIIRHRFVMIALIWECRTPGNTGTCGMHIKACFLGHNGERRFVENTG